ncbi:MAG: toll/interleukin-1 receptor domain-containing protein [Desulfobacteraceae bacterium]
MGRLRYIYFLAHAGCDTESAKQLRDLLHPEIPVFLDAYDLSPGDLWDAVLPNYQKQALATVAILSSSVDSAYYLREEIANAIAYQRQDNDRHRLIPVFMDGIPKNPDEVPYGVRVRHALDASKLGMEGVAAELRKFAADLSDAPPVSIPENIPKPAVRFAIYNALCKLLESQFNEVEFRVAAPIQHLSPAGHPLSRRALDLVHWAEQGGSTRMAALSQAIRDAAPGLL